MSVVQIIPWRNLQTWVVPGTTVGGTKWPLVPLADLLVQLAPLSYEPQSEEVVRFAGVRWYGKGVFIREERTPDQISAKCYPLIPGSIVYNRLFGWKSAFALVGEELAGVVVSSEFPQFEINSGRVLPSFINLVLGSPAFAPVMLARSTGSTAVSRNRLHVDDFLSLEVPVPDLTTQERLVAEHDAAMREAEKADAAATETRLAADEAFCNALGISIVEDAALPGGLVSIARFSALDRWDVESAGDAMASKYPFEPLERYADIRLGCQVPRRGTVAEGTVERPYLRAANVQRGWFSTADVKRMYVLPSTAAALRLMPNDILFVEGNSQTEVGRVAVWQRDDETIIQNSVVRARPHDDLDAHFAAAWFNTIPGRRYFFKNATTTTGSLWHIGSGKVGQAPIPAAPLSLQHELAAAHTEDIARANADAERARELRRSAVDEFAATVFGAEAELADIVSDEEGESDAQP
jgi:type I restriction enzyme S subunit